MPRRARVIVAGMPHHIVQRGHNRKAVFVEPDDYRYYLENLQEWKLALNNVDKALKLGKLQQPSSAYILKGLILFNLDDLAYARDSFEEAQKFAEAEKMADQWLRYIDGEQKRREYMAANT